MQTIVGETLIERTIFIDGIRFERCRFVRCQLFYTGRDPALLQDCTLEQCEWAFEEAAENMFALLSSVYRRTNGEGKVLVETIFQGIKDGTIVGESGVRPVPALA